MPVKTSGQDCTACGHGPGIPAIACLVRRKYLAVNTQFDRSAAVLIFQPAEEGRAVAQCHGRGRSGMSGGSIDEVYGMHKYA